MKITLSGAMRARDVSRPSDEQLAVAAEREAKNARAGRPGGAADAASAISNAPKAPPVERDAGPAGDPDSAGRGRPADPDERAANDVPAPTWRRRRRGR